VHIFSDYGTWAPQDARHLIGPAALQFGEPSWLAAGDEQSVWEAAWWGYDISRTPVPNGETPRVARLFEHAGIAVARSDRAYLLVTNGRVGTNGFGNHKHNDLLSFEFHSDGVPLIVDPGSYVYTSNPDARNLFRGTAYHNTLQIDGVEQNDIRPDYLFRMFETSSVTHVAFEDAADRVVYRGSHSGYERLPAPVTHERTFRLDKTSGALVVTDHLRGSGLHTLKWHFHLAPHVDIQKTIDRHLALVTTRGSWSICPDQPMNAAVSDAWYSPSYGVRTPCRAIDFVVTADVSAEPSFVFHILPSR
jgi:hypothetical protein